MRLVARMKNMVVARILNEIADMLEVKDVQFKPRAYRRAARTVESLAKPIEDVYAEGGLQELAGVGARIAEKIAEIVETGSCSYYEKLKKELPVDVHALTAVEGVGPQTVKKLYQELGIKTLEDLERAAKRHEIREVEGFGPTTEKNILDHIQLARRSKERVLLGYALPIAEEIKARLKEGAAIGRIEVAGSLRRMKETVGDIDILVTSNKPKEVADFFTGMKDVREVLGKGTTKCSVIMKNDLQVDLRIIDETSYGSALAYFTGSKDHNIELRKIAIDKGYKLNEYGLFQKEQQIAGTTEEAIYAKLGLDFIAPELRENRGEIAAAKEHQLPDLIGYDAVKGDLQMHTDWSDGAQTIEEMATAAKELGYDYICISDHYSETMKIAGGLNDRQLRKELEEIDNVNSKVSDIEILKGAEVNIDADGEIRVNKNILKELDVVVASVHSQFNQPKQEMTDRLITAMESGYVHIIGHPTGRKINKKKPSAIDMEQLFEASKQTGTYLEINSLPERLDLSEVNAQAAVEAGCKLAINTDSHNKSHLRFMKLGLAVARRGWLEKEDVINTRNLQELRKLLKR
jgi:DNA polymerase (family 10)